MIDEYMPSLKKETVIVEKKVFDVLQKNNLDLIEKLEEAKEALRFYADADMYEYYDKYESTAVQHDGGEWARKVLEEIEK